MKDKQSIIKLILGTGIGNVVEWYTFLVYAYLSPQISTLFFPHQLKAEAGILTFLIFAIGFLARPLGSIIFGYLGDILGRRKTLILSQTLMLITSIFITFLPTYGTLGISAAFLLAFFRIIQGLSIAGEYTTSLCYLAEVSPNHQKGKWVSTVPASTALGILVSSLVVFIFSELLGSEEMLAWGWRACFFIGVLICATGVYLRIILPESEVFLKFKEKKLKYSFSKSTLKSMLFVALEVVAYSYFYQFLFIWLPISIFPKNADNHSATLLINAIAMLIFMGSTIYGGHLADKIGHKKTMLLGSFLIVIFILPAMYLLQNYKTNINFALFEFVFSLIFGLFVGSASTYFSLVFKPVQRSSALSLSYNIPYAIFGGLSPVALSLLNAHYEFLSITYLNICIFLLAFILIFFLPKVANNE